MSFFSLYLLIIYCWFYSLLCCLAKGHYSIANDKTRCNRKAIILNVHLGTGNCCFETIKDHTF